MFDNRRLSVISSSTQDVQRLCIGCGLIQGLLRENCGHFDAICFLCRQFSSFSHIWPLTRVNSPLFISSWLGINIGVIQHTRRQKTLLFSGRWSRTSIIALSDTFYVTANVFAFLWNFKENWKGAFGAETHRQWTCLSGHRFRQVSALGRLCLWDFDR